MIDLLKSGVNHRYAPIALPEHELAARVSRHVVYKQSPRVYDGRDDGLAISCKFIYGSTQLIQKEVALLINGDAAAIIKDVNEEKLRG
jgi:hypothetical protein